MTKPITTAKAEMLIRKSTAQVFEAFIDPEITTKFWFTHSSGKLEEGASITWTWAMYNLDVPLVVKKIVANESILIEWGEGPQRSLVEWQFKPIAKDKTFVTITNYGFQGEGDDLTNQVIDSTGGFTLVVAGLKAWLEYQIELNLVGDKFPKEMMGG